MDNESTNDANGMAQISNELALSRRDVLKGISITTLGLAAGGSIVLPAVGATSAGAHWWEKEYRILQTNLREIDALQDPREIARAVKDFGATAIVSNIGGIVAFYPTQLELQYKNPYLKGDFVGEMLEAARSHGLTYIGRYDLSKAMKVAYDAHPEWFVKNRNGGPREYAGTYEACPNGGWAQEYGFEILREGLTRYDAEGLFFNMVGYSSTNYSNIAHGICVCDNCRRRFREMYGLELPAKDDASDPNWRSYSEFRTRTSAELSARMRAFAHKLRPNAPLLDGYDRVVRSESQRRVDRPAPEWAYQSGEQTRIILGTLSDKPFSATSTAHIDYPWRQVTESAACHVLRMAQALGLGAKLDLYLMGTLADQNDQRWLPPVSQLYKWHAANAQHYAGLTPAMRVALYRRDFWPTTKAEMPWNYSEQAGRGAYSALVDARLPFWMVTGPSLGVAQQYPALLQGYDVIVAPHAMQLSDAEAAALDAWVERGGLLIATGMTGSHDEHGKPRTKMPLASSPVEAFGTPVDAHGWSLNDAGAELDFGGARIALDGHYFPTTIRAGARNLSPFAPDQRFGPPELSYAIPGTKPRNDPGVLIKAFGRGHAVHIPWLPDWHYYRDGLDAHRELFAALIARFAPPAPFVLQGDGQVEMTVQRQAATGKTLVHVINYAGQRNTRYSTPPALHGLKLGVLPQVAAQARLLVGGQTIKASRKDADGRRWFDLPPVHDFEAIQFADA